MAVIHMVSHGISGNVTEEITLTPWTVNSACKCHIYDYKHISQDQ